MKQEIEVYASDVQVHPLDKDQVIVYLKDIDVAQIVAELPVQDVLEALELSDVVDFAAKNVNV